MTYSERFSKLALSDFAEGAARIAQVSAQWAADTMMSHDHLDSPMLHESVQRFAEEIITRVHRITERARGE